MIYNLLSLILEYTRTRGINLISSASIALAMTTLMCCTGRQSMHIYNIVEYGAKADSLTDNAVAIQKAIDQCSSNGGGTVLVPAGGVFISGPFELRSNVNLYLEANSKILANPDETIYNKSAFGANEGEGMMWISGKDLENVTISGEGHIDGNGIAFMAEEYDDYIDLKPVTTFDPRPHVLTLINIKNLRIKDLTIGNSAYWTIHLIGCNDVVVDNVSIINGLKVRNSDGIDVDHSKNVRIANCHIESGDDCICLKNRREWNEYGSCHDIVVNNCTMISRSCAIKIGSEVADSIYRVLFNNCIIKDSNRGIGVQNRDEGIIYDITFSNMIVDCRFWSDIWWGKSEAIYVTSYPRAIGNHKDAGWRFPKGATEGRSGEVHDIRFINISCTSENGIFVGGDTPDKINNIYFNNVKVNIVGRTDYPGRLYDCRPCAGEPFIYDNTYAFYIKDASSIFLDNCSYTTDGKRDVVDLINPCNNTLHPSTCQFIVNPQQ